jgi:hypothetical protein
MIKLGKRVILTAYRAGFSWTSHQGYELDRDPDVFAVWVYLGFFGLGIMWCREGWITTREAAMEGTALAVLAGAPDPRVQTPAFLAAWDELDRDGCR